MVLRVVLSSNVIADTACHRNSRKTCCTNERVDFLLGEEVKELHEHDTSGDRESERKESTYDDTDGSPVEKCLDGHSGTDAESKEHSCGVHNRVADGVEETVGVSTDFLE